MKKKILSRAVCVALSFLIAFGMLPAGALAAGSLLTGTDAARHWAEKDILYWADAGVIKGYPDGTYRPNNPITFGEFAVMLNRYMGYPAQNPKSDSVPAGEWYSGDIGALESVGAIAEGDNADVGTPISREQAAAMFARVLDLPQDSMPAFGDAGSISPAYAGAIAAVQSKGYVMGKPGNVFDPKGNITRAEMCTILSRVAAVDGDNLIARPAAVQQPVPDKGEKPGADEFVLLYDEAADLYMDGGDWEGVWLALSSLQSDIELVGGKKPELTNDASSLSKMAVIVGTIGKSELIDKLIAEGKIDVSAVEGKWESYIIDVVENPAEGVERGLVIAGSDKRGTIYGIYKISEEIGVSPWLWWADSVPERQGKLTFAGDYSVVQGEPSVKYRGIFLNDEAPSLSGWVSENFGSLENPQATKGYDHEFYAKVFELLLRLKGNYLWPTMWNNSFNTDDPLNPVTADKYGIVMGTSHQEHMTCADKEWSWSGLGVWNYFTNRDNVYNFWKDGVTERKDYETILTIGMRGQADTSILGPNATLADNIKLLEDVISDQREIIKDVYGAEDAAPQLLALYKEVEGFYYGDEDYGNLEVPEDVTLMLCDDNFGNVRTLPTEEMRGRSGGFGMYYHFDYRGDPISYEWINQTPLTKVWEQMTMAYDAGVDRIWIVNVGDLKPMELPIDYFLNLAYDYGQWSPANKVDEFTLEFAAREFGEGVAADAADVLNGYTKINGARKAEVVMSDPSTFSLTAFDEADTVLRAYEEVVEKAESIYAGLPYYKQDTFYQLALYPARASMNIYKTNIYAAWSKFLAAEGLSAANDYARLAQEAFDADAADTKRYNTTISNGKWDGIMKQNHIAYTTWDGPTTNVSPNMMPEVGTVQPDAGSELAVRVQGSDKIVRSGTAELPVFSSLNQENRYIDIFNGMSLPFTFTLTTDAPWLVLGATDGVCVSQTRIGISVDWSKVTADATGTVTVTGADAEVKVKVSAKMFTGSIADNTYVETDGYVSINPTRYAANMAAGGAEWTLIDDYGRDGDSIKVLPNGKAFTDAKNAPYIEYNFYLQTAGTYNVFTFVAPSTNPEHKTAASMLEQLRYSAQIDGGDIKTQTGLIDASFAAGDSNVWRYGVMNNTRMAVTEHQALTEGMHTLRIYAVDPGVVIQKIVIAPGTEKQTAIAGAPQTYHFMNSYFGPPESYCAGVNKQGTTYPAIDAGILQYSGTDVQVTFEMGEGQDAVKLTAYAANGCKLTAEQIASVKTPVRDGYTFLGWLLTPNGVALGDDIIFAEPTTIKPSFVSASAITYSYFANGGTGDEYEEGIPAGQTMTISDCKFTNAGKVFSHWNTKADGSGDTYSPTAESAALNDIDLYAIWADAESGIRASSSLAGSGAANAFDSDDSTAWKLTGVSNEWVEFTLNDTYTLDSLYVNEDGNNIQSYEIQSWNAAESKWDSLLAGETLGPDANPLFFAATPVQTNKLRLNIISAKNPPVIKEIKVVPFINWALEANGGEITAVPEGGEGELPTMIDGDRIDYTKRWRINSQEGFEDYVTLMLREQKNISVVNIFSISSLWNIKPVDIRRDTFGTSALGTISNLKIEYTADGTSWLPLPGGDIEGNPYSLITVNLDEPVAMIGLRFSVPDQQNTDYNDSWIRVVEIETLELLDTTGIFKQ